MLIFLKTLVIGIFVSNFFIKNFLKDLFCGKTTLSKSSIKKHLYSIFWVRLCISNGQEISKYLLVFGDFVNVFVKKKLMIYMHYMLKFQIFNDVHYFQVCNFITTRFNFIFQWVNDLV
jgi:hypothetical protein